MTTHSCHIESDEFYFCTVTCYKWINLIEITNLYDHILKWFDILYINKTWISGYVIMPNHFHLILYVTRNSQSLNKLIANGKRFMAYEIVNRLKEHGKEQLLRYLSRSVPINEKLKNKKHQIFIPSFDAKVCLSTSMLEKKLDYIHFNPVSGNWNLVSSFEEYPYSSAKYYEKGEKIRYRWFKDYQEIIGI